jgi:flagellar motor switch protein FliM
MSPVKYVNPLHAHVFELEGCVLCCVPYHMLEHIREQNTTHHLKTHISIEDFQI